MAARLNEDRPGRLSCAVSLEGREMLERIKAETGVTRSRLVEVGIVLLGKLHAGELQAKSGPKPKSGAVDDDGEAA